MIISLKKTQRISGYMTVEASFIVPWVFMLFILVLYFTFHLYNTDVVYQDCYIAALRGSQIHNADNGFVKNYVEGQISELLNNQLYEYSKEANVNISVTSIEVEAQSEMNINQGKLMMYRNKLLDTEQSAKAYRLNPVYLIRISER